MIFRLLANIGRVEHNIKDALAASLLGSVALGDFSLDCANLVPDFVDDYLDVVITFFLLLLFLALVVAKPVHGASETALAGVLLRVNVVLILRRGFDALFSFLHSLLVHLLYYLVFEVKNVEELHLVVLDCEVDDLSADDHYQNEVLEYVHEVELVLLVVRFEPHLSHVLLLLHEIVLETQVPPERVSQ